LKKLFSLLILLPLLTIYVRAQTQPFGKIDTADLKMTSCDFEKDANAVVLFDKAEVTTGFTSTTILRHKRIKILNNKGTDEANVSLEYYSYHGLEEISNIEAETININNNAIEFLTVDKALMYHETIDRSRKKVVFTFPEVKAGSVIEYSYKLTIASEGSFPDWDFQSDLPVRYSELKASIRKDYSYKIIPRINQAYTKNTYEPWINGNNDTIGNKYEWAVTNINSYSEEPYATSMQDNLQGIQFILVAIKFTSHGNMRSLEKPWRQIGGELVDDTDFGEQLKDNLNDADLIKQAKLLSTDNEKISYIFNQVKATVKWDGSNRWYTNDGVKKAWDKKTGNSTEINLILYNLLRQAGIKCYPMVVSTRDNGKINSNYPDIHQFNKTVISIPVDDKKKYILDASDKFNTFSDIPFDILNSNGLFIDPVNQMYILIYLQNEKPSRKIIFINAQIEPGGKLEGTAQINSFNYNKINGLKLYNTLGESKYIEQLRNDDNNLKISSLKRENIEIDTLPLTENITFKLDLTGSDDTYIYFDPNLFTTLDANPFLSEKRSSAIDFGCLNNYAINGRYKIPEGYKIEALPKSISLVMPDKSIIFKRVVGEQDGDIIVHYTIDYKKAIYSVDEYSQIHEFYKKMYEMLNEQIVLKKG